MAESVRTVVTLHIGLWLNKYPIETLFPFFKIPFCHFLARYAMHISALFCISYYILCLFRHSKMDESSRKLPYSFLWWDQCAMHGAVFTSIFIKVAYLQICRLQSILIHFFFTAAFIFMLLESLHSYSLVAYVVKRNGILSKLQNTLLGWGLALANVLLVLGLNYEDYGGKYHCWLQVDKPIMFYTIISKFRFIQYFDE